MNSSPETTPPPKSELELLCENRDISLVFMKRQAQEIFDDFFGIDGAEPRHQTKLARRMKHKEPGTASEYGTLIHEILYDIPNSGKKRFLERAISVGLDIYKDMWRGNKYTKYACHPARVALLVKDAGGDEIAIARAFLHDALELFIEKEIEKRYSPQDSQTHEVPPEEIISIREQGIDYIRQRLRKYPPFKRGKTLKSIITLTRFNKAGNWLEDDYYLPQIEDEIDLAIKGYDRADSGFGDIAQAYTISTTRKSDIEKTIRRAKSSQEKNINTLRAIGEDAPVDAIKELIIATETTNILLSKYGRLLAETIEPSDISS